MGCRESPVEIWALDHLSASSTGGEYLLCKPEAKIDPGWRVEAFRIILTEN